MADTPTVSVVVPTFARPAQLRRCLDGIVRLEAATFSFEVIVVDDGGAEPLDTLIDLYAEGLDIRLISAVAQGPGRRTQRRRRSRTGRVSRLYRRRLHTCTRLALRIRTRARTGRPPTTWWICRERADRESLFDCERAYLAVRLRIQPHRRRARAVLHDEQHRACGRPVSCRRRIWDVHSKRDRRGQRVLRSLALTRTRPHACPLCGRPSRARPHVRAVSSAALRLRPWHPGFPSDWRSRVESPFLPEPLKFYTDLVLSPMYRPSSVGRLRLAALLLAAQLATVVGALHEALTWPPLTGARDDEPPIGPDLVMPPSAARLGHRPLLCQYQPKR